MYRILITSLLLMLSIGAWAQPASTRTAPLQTLDSIAAVVNKNVITERDLREQVAVVQGRLKHRKVSMPPVAQLRQQVLRHMIETELQVQLAGRLNMTVDDKKVDEVMLAIATSEHKTINEFERGLRKEKGMSVMQFKQELKQQLLITKLQKQELGGHIKISPEEITEYLKSDAHQQQLKTQYHVRNLLVQLPETPSTRDVQLAEHKAKRLVAELRKKGSDFSATAIAESAAANALQGGDMGWRKLSELPSIYADTLVTMHRGAVSDPLRTPNGFHILKLEGVRGQVKHTVSETHARHILIKTNVLLTTAKVKAKLNHIRSQVLKGQSFEKLAKAYSADPGSAVKGGDLGWVKPGIMVPNFQVAMDKTATGKISKPFKSRYGWHIVQVVARRKVDNSQAFQKDAARRAVFKRKFDESLQAWIRRLYDNAYIKILLKS